MSRSEIARIRQQIEQEYESARRGLEGAAITARHDFIQKRLQNVGACHEELSKMVGHVEACEIVIEICNDVTSRKKEEEHS